MTANIDNQSDNLYPRRRTQDRQRFPHGGAGSGYILDNQNSLSIARLMADEAAALSMVLQFLAIKGERDIPAMLPRQRHGRRHRQRDSLVSRPKQRVIAPRQMPLNCPGIKIAEALHFRPAVITSRVDEEGRAPAALGHKIAKGQYTRMDHELDELALIVFHAGHCNAKIGDVPLVYLFLWSSRSGSLTQSLSQSALNPL